MLEDLELKQVIELIDNLRTPLNKLFDFFKRMEWNRRYKHK